MKPNQLELRVDPAGGKAMNAPLSKLPPLTADEMRSLYAKGDPVSEIARQAYLRNGMRKAAVRQVLFGAPA